jgi:hypothetical protein
LALLNAAVVALVLRSCAGSRQGLFLWAQIPSTGGSVECSSSADGVDRTSPCSRRARDRQVQTLRRCAYFT